MTITEVAATGVAVAVAVAVAVVYSCCVRHRMVGRSECPCRMLHARSCKDDTGILCFALQGCIVCVCVRIFCLHCSLLELSGFSGKGFGCWHRSTGVAKAFWV